MGFRPGALQRLERALRDHEGAALLADTEVSDLVNEIEREAERMRGMRVRVAVIGSFSTGKSTLINALVGRVVLPAGVRPTTKQIVRIEHAEQGWMRVNGEPVCDTVPSPEDVRAHAQAERIEIGVPFSVCDKGWVWFDTPGIDDPHNVSEDIVHGLLPEADVILMLMSAQQPMTQTEKVFLREVASRSDLPKFFFAINRSDMLEGEQERAEIVAHMLPFVVESSGLAPDEAERRILFVSAQGMLEALNRGEDLPRDGRVLLDALGTFVRSRRGELEEAAALRNLRPKIEAAIGELDAMLHAISGEEEKARQDLEAKEAEMRAFEEKVAGEMQRLKKRLQAALDRFEGTLEEEKIQILHDLAQMLADNALDRPAPIWLRERLEEAMDRAFKRLAKGYGEAFDELAEDASPELRKALRYLGAYRPRPEVADLMATLGVSVAGYYLLTSLLPMLIGVTGTLFVGAGLYAWVKNSGIESVLKVARASGRAMQVAGSKGWEAAQRVRDASAEALRGVVLSRQQEEYLAQVKSAMEDAIRRIVRRVREEADPEEVARRILEARFPERRRLEQTVRAQRERTEQEIQHLREREQAIRSLRDKLLQEVMG